MLCRTSLMPFPRQTKAQTSRSIRPYVTLLSGRTANLFCSQFEIYTRMPFATCHNPERSVGHRRGPSTVQPYSSRTPAQAFQMRNLRSSRIVSSAAATRVRSVVGSDFLLWIWQYGQAERGCVCATGTTPRGCAPRLFGILDRLSVRRMQPTPAEHIGEFFSPVLARL